MKTGQLDPAIIEFIHEQNLDNVKDAFDCELGGDMWKPGLGNRRRTKLEFRDSTGRLWELFFKRYYPLPLVKRVWGFLTFRGKRSPGRTEFRNIHALHEAKVATMREVVYGEQCDFLGVKRSYIIVTSVPGDALERNGEAFLTRHQHDPLTLKMFNDKLIELVGRLHSSGLVHRDLYTSHIFLHDHDGHLELYLIDLARVFRPKKWRMFRWRVKDLAQLKYSAPWLWVTQYWKYFMDGYLSQHENENRQRWERAIDRKVTAMQKRDARKARKAKG